MMKLPASIPSVAFFTRGLKSGSIDQPTLGSQTLHYAPVVSTQWWTFKSVTLTIDGKSYSRVGNTAIPDTGTSLTLISAALCTQIYAKIKGAKSPRNHASDQ
jgi:Eukaryotic aspartyl protease